MKKNSIIKPLPGGSGQRKKDQKIAKKAENANIKPLSIISVPCMKFQGGPRPLAPCCRRPWCQRRRTVT